MYAGMLVLALLGYLLNRAFLLADARLLARYRRGAESAQGELPLTGIFLRHIVQTLTGCTDKGGRGRCARP